MVSSQCICSYASFDSLGPGQTRMQVDASWQTLLMQVGKQEFAWTCKDLHRIARSNENKSCMRVDES